MTMTMTMTMTLTLILTIRVFLRESIDVIVIDNLN